MLRRAMDSQRSCIIHPPLLPHVEDEHLVLCGLLVDIGLGLVAVLLDLVSEGVLSSRCTGTEGCVGVLGNVCRGRWVSWC